MSIDQSVLDKFEAVVESQRKRIMDMKAQDDFIDYSKLDKLIIGVCGGDGIGPMITGMAQHALEVLLADKVKAGKVEFRVIDGLTIERRAELGVCTSYRSYRKSRKYRDSTYILFAGRT